MSRYEYRCHQQRPIGSEGRPTPAIQSPHDTASLLMETNNFFLECSRFHEKYETFLHAITDLIIEFSEKQLEAIGPRSSLPGHQMLCHSRFKGISISDDMKS